MFDKKELTRLQAWLDFRNSLETAPNPIQDTITFYNRAPIVNFQVDPYDRKSWPTPWQLLNENQYCKFALLLGMFYTLKLTDRFAETAAEIHICKDTASSESLYLLHIDNMIIGYDRKTAINCSDLPTTILIETIYTMN